MLFRSAGEQTQGLARTEPQCSHRVALAPAFRIVCLLFHPFLELLFQFRKSTHDEDL